MNINSTIESTSFPEYSTTDTREFPLNVPFYKRVPPNDHKHDSSHQILSLDLHPSSYCHQEPVIAAVAPAVESFDSQDSFDFVQGHGGVVDSHTTFQRNAFNSCATSHDYVPRENPLPSMKNIFERCHLSQENSSSSSLASLVEAAAVMEDQRKAECESSWNSNYPLSMVQQSQGCLQSGPAAPYAIFPTIRNQVHYPTNGQVFYTPQGQQVPVAFMTSEGFAAVDPRVYASMVYNGSLPQSYLVHHNPTPQAHSQENPRKNKDKKKDGKDKVERNAPRRYLCSICNKRFTRPSTLGTHMNSHTGERPFECSTVGCGWRFTVLSNLKRHMKICSNESKKSD